MNLPSQINEILLKLNQQGFEAYMVGGCVRDYFTNTDSHDFDITTSATPEQIIKVLNGYTLVPTGIKFGTITVVFDLFCVEITTFRSEDGYLDRRHPESVKFETDLKLDLLRRDFTMNAIAYGSDGRFTDLYGGIEDIKNGIIRAVGNPKLRFKEDALRILRALRFSATLGFEIEAKTKKELLNAADSLKNVSGERKLSELKKLLVGKNVGSVLCEYKEVFKVLLGLEKMPLSWETVASTIDSLPLDFPLRLCHMLRFLGLEDISFLSLKDMTPLLRRASLAASFLKSVQISETILNDIKSDNKTKTTVLFLISALPIMQSEAEVSLYLSNTKTEQFSELLSLEYAVIDTPLSPFLKSELEYIETAAAKLISENRVIYLKDLKINGYDLLKLGFKGKEISQLLNALKRDVIIGKLKNDKDELVKKAEGLKK